MIHIYIAYLLRKIYTLAALGALGRSTSPLSGGTGRGCAAA